MRTPTSHLRAAAIAALVFSLLAGCKEKVDIDEGPHAVEFEWRIVDKATLRAVYANSGMPITSDDHLDGFAGYDATGTWVIYTTKPQRLDDRATCTLGHEVLHIVAGDYHR